MFPLHTTLAYKFVLTAAIYAFANHYAPRLNLPFETPLKESQLQHPARAGGAECDPIMTRYGGGLRVNGYSIGFDDGFYHSGYSEFDGLFTITKLEDDGMKSFGIPMLHLHESSSSLMERASQMPYTVTTNDLARIATNYLTALEIDVSSFEKKNQLKIDLEPFHSNRGLVPDPILQVYWGKPNSSHSIRDTGTNGMGFEISAVSGELLEMNVGNASGCKGLPLLKLDEFPKLLAITDEEFLKMSDTERTNLLYRFANNYLFPPPARTSQFSMRQTTNLPAIHSPTNPATSP